MFILQLNHQRLWKLHHKPIGPKKGATGASSSAGAGAGGGGLQGQVRSPPPVPRKTMGVMGLKLEYPLVNIQKAIENGHL